MRILFAASEMVPFCKTGGLADVIGALPPVLAHKGHTVSVMLPGYSIIDRKRYDFKSLDNGFTIPMGDDSKPIGISAARWNGVDVYLLENSEFFDRENLYGDADGDYSDNGQRFVFYSRAVVESAKHLRISPDIVHAHDWQAGLVVAYLATVYVSEREFHDTAALFTIHNLGYQGLFPPKILELTGISQEEFHWTKMEFWGKLSLLKSGIVNADAISTVSETYAREITGEELGFGLDGALMQRSGDLYGILNGIDQEQWDPATDTSLPALYGPDDITGKKTCRSALLKNCRLKANVDTPVIGMVSRLDDQKGMDIFGEAVGRILAMDTRLVILGTGAREYHEALTKLAERYPGNLCVMLRFDNDLARLVYAGSDAFIMPSRYEPCGLGQMIAMRYGTVPIVHATGGLADTVRDLDDHPKDGNGFTFNEYSSEALVEAAARAVSSFRKKGKARWKGAMQRGMTADYSWDNAAGKYIALYERIGNRTRR